MVIMMTTVIALLHFPQEQALDFKYSRVCYLVLARVAHTINEENVLNSSKFP